MGVLTDQMRDDIERLIDERDDALARIAAFLPIGGSALAALDAAHADLRHPYDPPGREYASAAGRAADMLRAGLLALDGITAQINDSKDGTR